MKLFTFCLLFATAFYGCTTRFRSEQKSAINRQLDEMIKTDQLAASRWEDKWITYKDSVYGSHKVIVEKMFREHGFLGFDKIGEEGSGNFWLIVQHCDDYPDFQRKVLEKMDLEVKKKNADPNNYAYLFDRVQVNAGLKQKFGTQLDYDVNLTGRAFPKIGLLDSTSVDQFRADYHLGPLRDYLNQMTEMHFEMNRERYEKMGLIKPNLY